ncbi:MAG: aquaporin [Daejeonella sp.]
MGIAITFGLIILAMIYTFGEVSGAHFNPAVTIAFSIAGLLPRKQVLYYLIAQLIGAFIATGLLKLLFPANETLGATLPAGGQMQSAVLEFVLTFILMLVILFTSQGSKEVGTMAGLAIGGTILLEAMFAGPVSGASMNPARSISPAVISGHIETLWLYIISPISGAAFATLIWRILK